MKHRFGNLLLKKEKQYLNFVAIEKPKRCLGNWKIYLMYKDRITQTPKTFVVLQTVKRYNKNK